MRPSSEEEGRELAANTAENRLIRNSWLGVPGNVAIWVAPLMLLGVLYSISLWGMRPLARTTDTDYYQLLARDLTTLRIFPFRTIGYPLMLAITGSQHHLTQALFIVQLLFHLCVIWMTLALAQRFSLPRLPMIALAVVLLSPPLMVKVSDGLTEASCEFFVTLSVLGFVRWAERFRAGDALLAGFAIAIASLIRPTFMLLGILMSLAAMAWLWPKGRARAMRSAALLAAGSVLVLGGTTVLNGVHFGYWGPSPLAGWDLSTKTAPFIEFLPNSEPAKPYLVEWRDEDLATYPGGQGLNYIWNRGHVMELVARLHGDPSSGWTGMSNRWYSAASNHLLWMNLRLMAAQPAKYAASVATATSNYVLPSDTGIATDTSPAFRMAFVLAHFAFMAVFIAQLFGVCGLLLARRLGARVRGPIDLPRAVRTWWPATVVIFYTGLVSTWLSVGLPRFRTPTDPLILLLVFGGTYATMTALRSEKSPAIEGQEGPRVGSGLRP